MRHSVVVAHVAARLELAGEQLLSEREIAAAERLEEKRIYSAELRERGYYRPDLIALTDQVEAIEVELTNKGPRRLDEIMRRWRLAVSARKLARVIYLCPPRTLRYVAMAALRVEAAGEGGVVVAPLRLPDLQLPGPTRQPSGGLSAAVKGLRPDPLRGLTAAPPPLPSRVGRGDGQVSAR